MKKRIYPNLALVIEGRLFLAMVNGARICFVWLTIMVFANGDIEIDFSTIILAIFGFCFMVVGPCFLNYLFWHYSWGKLVLTDDSITWRCLFCKPIKIRYDELKYIDIRLFKEGNVYRNSQVHMSNAVFALMSSEPLPNKRIDKIRSGKKLIKFQVTPKVGKQLYDNLPKPYNARFWRYARIKLYRK